MAPIKSNHAGATSSWPVEGRVTVKDIQKAKDRGEHWAMLTSYDALTAGIFERSGIHALLVGDSSSELVLGHDSTLPIDMAEMLVFVQAVVRGSNHALIVADLPFGSYQEGPTQALKNAVRFLKSGGAQAVKLEGGRSVIPQIRALVQAGIPVMGHLGLTPQSVNTLGGLRRVQGRGEAADKLIEESLAIQEAGAFAIVLEAIPAALGEQVTTSLDIPTIGIGAGPGCDAQILLWPDMAGLTNGRLPKFVKAYADVSGVLSNASRTFADEVRLGHYPSAEYAYE